MAPPDEIGIGQRIAAYEDVRGLSHRQLADRAHVTMLKRAGADRIITYAALDLARLRA